MRKITYLEFTRFLREEGYTPAEAMHLYREMKKLSPKVRSWVIDWFNEGVYPADVVEGITVQMMVESGNLKPINAFICMDWLIKDPADAKYALTHVVQPLPVKPDEYESQLPADMEEPIDDEGITD